MFLILARPPFIPILIIPFVLLKKENKKFNYFLFISFIFFLILSLFFILTFPTPSSPINLEYFFSNPTNFLKIIVLNLYFNTFTYVLQFIGYLGHINISLPISVYLFFSFSIFFILLLTLYNDKKSLIKYFDTLIIITATIGACILIFISQYLYFTEITNRDTFIQGVAGRYFIPLAIILTSILPKIKKDFYLAKIIIIVTPHINIITLNKIYNFFY
jgi:hypothetical protein